MPRLGMNLGVRILHRAAELHKRAASFPGPECSFRCGGGLRADCRRNGVSRLPSVALADVSMGRRAGPAAVCRALSSYRAALATGVARVVSVQPARRAVAALASAVPEAAGCAGDGARLGAYPRKRTGGRADARNVRLARHCRLPAGRRDDPLSKECLYR
jgi:hypothetical protein